MMTILRHVGSLERTTFFAEWPLAKLNWFRAEQSGEKTSNHKFTSRAVFAGLVLLASFIVPSQVALASCPDITPTITLNADFTTLHNFFVNDIPRAVNDGEIICLNPSPGGVPLDYNNGIDLSKGGTISVTLWGSGPLRGICTNADLRALGLGAVDAEYLQGGCGSAGQTILRIGSSVPNLNAMFGWFGNSSTHHMTIANIQFVRDANSGINAQNVTVTLSPIAGTYANASIIHHNDFLNEGNTNHNCQGYDILTGTNQLVVYRNRFVSAGPIPACGNTNTNLNGWTAQNTDQAGWATAGTWGSLDTASPNSNFYFEQNFVWDYNVLNDWSTGNVRAVERFNELHNSSSVGHGFDSGSSGPRGMEYYGNSHYCDDVFKVASWVGYRGGTGYILLNNFPTWDTSKCANSLLTAAINFQQDRAIECDVIPGWPGQYKTGSSDTYPIAHQMGWGWISATQQTYGHSSGVGGNPLTQQGQPGVNGYPVDGFQQSLEPWYFAANTNLTGTGPTNIDNRAGTCRAMAYSTQTRALDTHTVLPDAGTNLPVYANIGQQLFIAIADQINSGSMSVAVTQSGSSSCGTPTALNAGTTGTLRLSAWTCTVTADGPQVITFTHDSSSAARAATVIVMRGLTVSPVDQNAAVKTNTSSNTFTSNSITNTNASDIVLGYYAAAVPGTDSLSAVSPGSLPIACAFAACGTLLDSGVNGTAGGSPDVSILTSYQVLDSSLGTQTLTVSGQDTTQAVASLAGIVSFKVTGSTASPLGQSNALDLTSDEFIKFDREVYNDVPATGGSFNGTTGTGTGLASGVPNGAGGACTNGTGYWATDVGSWNTTSYNGGKSGALFVCGQHATSGHWPASLTTGNAFYIPATMPNALATVDGNSNSMVFTQQPTPLQSGTSFSPIVKVTVNPAAADSITITKTCAGGTLTGTQTQTSNGTTGEADFTGMGMTGVDPSCTLTATNNTDATISPITSNAFALTCAPTKVVFTSQPTGASLGASLGTVSVTEEDNSGNVCSLATDTITLSKDAGATWGTLVSSSNLAKAATAGVATWTDLSVTTTAGTGSIDATSPGLTSATSNSINITGGACTPDHLTFISQPQSALIGQNIGTIQVAVKDAGGNTCNDTSTVTLAKHAGTCTGMTLNGTVSGSAVAGVFQTSNVNMTVAAGACQLDATNGALTGATSSIFSIRAPAAGAGGRAPMILRRGR